VGDAESQTEIGVSGAATNDLVTLVSKDDLVTVAVIAAAFICGGVRVSRTRWTRSDVCAYHWTSESRSATILLISALMSSIGGTSGLGWMMVQFLDRKHVEVSPPKPITRIVKWIVGCAVFVVAYAAVFGPTFNV
jgi:hypothetical protein